MSAATPRWPRRWWSAGHRRSRRAPSPIGPSTARAELPDIAVVVQLMIAAEKAGVAFTADPVSGRRDRVVVEAAWGQGEVVVSGRVEPDTYVVDPDGPRLVSVRRGMQTSKIDAAPGGGDRALPLAPSQSGPVLSQEEAEAVAALALRVQAHYGRPQDLEWVISGGQLFLVQTRPITTLSDARHGPDEPCAGGRRAARGGVGDRAGPARPRRIAGARNGARPRPALSRGGQPPAQRRGARRPADQPGLDAGRTQGGRPGDRHRRRHLPRRDRGPRARRAGRRRHAHRAPGPSTTATR